MSKIESVRNCKKPKKSLSSSIVNDFCHFSLVRQRQIAHLNDFDAFLWDLQRHFERFLQSWSVDDVGECRKEDSFTSEFSSFLRAEKENVIRSLLYVFLQRESHDYWVAFASNLESLRALTMMTMLMCWNYMIWKLQKKEREWEVWLMRFFFFFCFFTSCLGNTKCAGCCAAFEQTTQKKTKSFKDIMHGWHYL